jgi:hypothetical protein
MMFSPSSRNQGDSDGMEGYEPLQWLTSYEVADTQAAIAYLKSRRRRSQGIGFFGISKGPTPDLPPPRNQAIRCIVTDALWHVHDDGAPDASGLPSTANYLTHGLLPAWFYGLIAKAGSTASSIPGMFASSTSRNTWRA